MGLRWTRSRPRGGPHPQQDGVGEQDARGGAVVGLAVEEDVAEGVGQGLLKDTHPGRRPLQGGRDIAGDRLDAVPVLVVVYVVQACAVAGEGGAGAGQRGCSRCPAIRTQARSYASSCCGEVSAPGSQTRSMAHCGRGGSWAICFSRGERPPGSSAKPAS